MPRRAPSWTSANGRETASEGATALDAGGIVIRDHAALRGWVVRIVAARAVALYRERKSGIDKAAGPHGSADGHDSESRNERKEWSRRA